MPLDFARDVLRRGWMPLPVPYKSKNPNFKGWQRFSITENELPTHFNGQPQNIGVLLGKPSGGLTDVDLDCPESIALASYFLPPNVSLFGRHSKPRSHYLYIVTDVEAKTVKFEDTDGQMLLELRSTGCQTIFPGSTHPSGEQVEWHTDGEPLRVPYAELLRAVRRIAAACLIVRHYPVKGSRNNLALALTGGLLRAAWTEEETEHFISAVCMAADDEETRARVRGVISTAAKLKNAEPVTGWPTLSKLITDAAVKRIRQWLEVRDPNPQTSGNTANGAEMKSDDSPLCVVRMADVEPQTVSWLWHPYIALGKLTILEGDPGLGKSWLTCALAAAISGGGKIPGAAPFEDGNVLMLSAEDGLADTLRPRLDAVGANLDRVFALNEPLTLDALGMTRLEAAIIEHAPVLVIIDPLFAYTGGKVDIHRANECRAISAPLAAIAERRGCAIVALRHLTKAAGRTAMNAGIGSVDIRAAARSVLLVGADPDAPTRRAIVQTKNNLAMEGKAIGYKIEDGQFWWTGESDLTAGRILASVTDEEARGAQAEAIDYLREALADGPRPSKEIKAEAMQAGFTEQMLRSARRRLGIKPRKEGQPGSNDQRWMWSLPQAEDVNEYAEDVSGSGNQHLRASDSDKGSYSQHLAEDVDNSVRQHLRTNDNASSAQDEPLTDEEVELAARLEFMEHMPRQEAEQRARK